ncbi:hypothetical protein SASPL_133183 [Salvia splendens]|uniref:Transposase-associated domain-containing protein n=1 Tax=Salvia splendens TaxID=180675 RepID=A0A8X8X3B7_SALSN|nr:hypothetical protein SASPL_133183 [Salvia splendens]
MCPCKRCQMVIFVSRDEAYEHLTFDGFIPGYTDWIAHGELPSILASRHENQHNNVEALGDDDMQGLVHDVFGVSNEDGYTDVTNSQMDSEIANGQARDFYRLIDDSQQPLYEGCEKRKVAQKVLWYFPLKPRLQRLFMSSKTTSHMRWHAESRTKDGYMRHPANSPAWSTFDSLHPDFSKESGNVRLGLTSDGINPFKNMNLDGKSKDNYKSRQDLEQMGIRPELHPITKEQGKVYLPAATFTMSKKERTIFCQVLKNLKVLDGYASNISRCVKCESSLDSNVE